MLYRLLIVFIFPLVLQAENRKELCRAYLEVISVPELRDRVYTEDEAARALGILKSTSRSLKEHSREGYVYSPSEASIVSSNLLHSAVRWLSANNVKFGYREVGSTLRGKFRQVIILPDPSTPLGRWAAKLNESGTQAIYSPDALLKFKMGGAYVPGNPTNSKLVGLISNLISGGALPMDTFFMPTSALIDLSPNEAMTVHEMVHWRVSKTLRTGPETFSGLVFSPFKEIPKDPEIYSLIASLDARLDAGLYKKRFVFDEITAHREMIDHDIAELVRNPSVERTREIIDRLFYGSANALDVLARSWRVLALALENIEKGVVYRKSGPLTWVTHSVAVKGPNGLESFALQIPFLTSTGDPSLSKELYISRLKQMRKELMEHYIVFSSAQNIKGVVESKELTQEERAHTLSSILMGIMSLSPLP